MEEYLFCARYWVGLHANQTGRCHYTHFTDLETEAQHGKVMLKFIQHAKTGIWES